MTRGVIQHVGELAPDAPILKFSGSFRFLSNFYPCGTRVVLPLPGGAEHSVLLTTPTIEHAYQAMKAPSAEMLYRILRAPTPAAARKIGRSITPRPGWEAERVATMRALVAMKFDARRGQAIDALMLRDRLLATGDRLLVEGNTWGDRFWGMTPVDEPNQAGDHVYGITTYRGENWLGQILMERRSAIRASRSGPGGRRAEI